METVEYPGPRPEISQSSFGPSLGHSFSNPFSWQTPSRLGPRHCGQSAAPTELLRISDATQATTANLTDIDILKPLSSTAFHLFCAGT